jgi:hypothetical protein
MTNSDKPAPARKPRISRRKLAANRQNARRSTGPRTPEGKAHSSMNALKHGILARATVNATLEGEDARREFETLLDRFTRDLAPHDVLQEMLVQQIVAGFWRLSKVLEFERKAAFRTYHTSADLAGARYSDWSGKTAGLYEHILREDEILPQAGLDRMTIPGDAQAHVILRYESTLNRTI